MTKGRGRLIASSGKQQTQTPQPCMMLKSLPLFQKMKGHEDDGYVS
jgi:hypothetical protein